MGRKWDWFARIADGLSVGQLLWTLAGAGAVVTAALTWAGQHWDWLASHGWGAVVFAAFGAVCAAGLIAALGLFAIGLIAMARRPRLSVQEVGSSPARASLTYDRDMQELRATLNGVANTVTMHGDFIKDILSAAPADKIAGLASEVGAFDRKFQAQDDILKATDRTILQLVHFATYQVVAASLDDMIATAPPVLPENELNEGARAKQLEYIGNIRSQLAGTHRGRSVANILAAAEHEAEQTIEDTPLNQRSPADPIRYRRWAIANRQVERLVMFLRAQRVEIEQSIIGCRPALIEEYTRRSPS